ncbi:MAG: MarR family transcriptional regulator [Roseburia sp.]
MEILKVKVLLCFFNMREQDLNVTNLAVTLGEEKYAISRVFTALEKEGLLDRSDRRRPQLTAMGKRMAEQYYHKVEGVIGHLLNAGVSQEDAKEDAIVMAVYCKDGTFAKLREQGVSRRIKLGFHEGMHFSGNRLCRLYKDGREPLTFLIYKEQFEEGSNLSKWNDRFENPCVLQVQDTQGMVLLHALRVSREYRFSYWDGNEWRGMEQHGSILSFPADSLQFVSVGKDEGRMLYGKVMIRIQKEEEKEEEHILFTTYIA